MGNQDEILLAVENEKKRLAELPSIPNLFPNERGVLLSDKIKKYCAQNYQLIAPFSPDSLRPAGYDLRIGNYYAVDGVKTSLAKGDTLVIRPYAVVVIETLETLNIPEFLIGRWNIRVKLAYRGLLWVGGAQVDPGYRGRLSCPIYNLSDEPVTLHHGLELAMIDFVTTTAPTAQSIKNDWKRVKIFDQHIEQGLTSGVKAQLDKMEETFKYQTADVERRSNLVNTRIDTFVTLVFAIVAVLFAGLGVVATKGSGDDFFFSSPVLIAAVALYFSLRACAKVTDHEAWTKAANHEVNQEPKPLLKPRSVRELVVNNQKEVAVCTLVVIAAVLGIAYQSRAASKRLSQAESADRARAAEYEEQSRDLAAYKRQMEAELKQIQMEIEVNETARLRAEHIKPQK